MKIFEHSPIVYTKNGAIGTILLNKKPANGYELNMLSLLARKIEEINSDDSLKVILVKSSSEKFFCAGADIKVFGSNTTNQNKAMVVKAREVSALMTNSDKIFVATINGHCLGGGMELALACDLRLAAEGTYLIGLPEIKLGLIPGNGGTPRLIRLIGLGRAFELLVSGDNISPKTAHTLGIFNQLFPVENFEEETETYIRKLATGPRKAMAAIKYFSRQSQGMNLEQSLALETECVNPLYETEDAKEGFRAFVEKRNPMYK